VEIRINGETINFTLEQEKALGEVVDGIQEWLAINGFAVTGIQRDSSVLEMGSRLEWQNDPVDEITSLEITAIHPTDFALDKLTAITQYLDLLRQEGNPESPVVADLLKGIDDVSQMIDDVVPAQGSDSVTFGSQFEKLAQGTGIIQGEVSVDGFNDFLAFVSELVVVLSSRMRELSDPTSELRSVAPILRAMLGEIGGVALLLQTGKDAQAMGQLIKFIEIVQKLLRLVHNLGEQAQLDLGIFKIEGAPVADFTGKLNDFLRELSGAMEAGDTILVGDLLEYEIGPKLSGFVTAIEESGVL
jgi:hypothetical protein